MRVVAVAMFMDDSPPGSQDWTRFLVILPNLPRIEPELYAIQETSPT